MSTSPPRTSSDSALRLEEFLPYRLNVLAETVSGSLARVYAERYGITIPEWRVLATLGQFERMSANGIGRHSRMHKTKVSRAVAALAAKEFLSREINEEDQREAFLGLTPHGRKVYESLVPDALAFARALTEELSGDERRVLDVVLARLMRKAEALAQGGAEEQAEPASLSLP